MINVGGELLDGFHFEQLPELNKDDTYSEDALSFLAGMRAVWLLYYKGQWSHLAEIGVRREQVENRLSVLPYGGRLTQAQALSLAKRVPEMELASVRLRMRYALLYRPRSIEGEI
jgi:hypothetical protein